MKADTLSRMYKSNTDGKIDFIKKIHQSGIKLALAITGGGAEAIGELCRHGGASNTLVEAIVPYDTKCTEELIGSKPDKFASVETARIISVACYERVQKLYPENAVGIGVTCSLTKGPGERVGRKHTAFIAAHTAHGTFSLALELSFGTDRTEQEQIVAQSILDVIYISHWMLQPFTTADLESRIRRGWAPIDGLQLATCNGNFAIAPAIDLEKQEIPDHGCIMPGSFNPIHEAHLEMAEYAAKLTGKPTLLEISVVNVDKPTLDWISVEERLRWIREKNSPYIAGVVLTRAPLFIKKAEQFPNHTFVVGTDTINRIADLHYYENAQHEAKAWLTFNAMNTEFLVFNRLGVDLNLGLFDKFCEVVIDGFTPKGISSTAIRKQKLESEA